MSDSPSSQHESSSSETPRAQADLSSHRSSISGHDTASTWSQQQPPFTQTLPPIAVAEPPSLSDELSSKLRALSATPTSAALTFPLTMPTSSFNDEQSLMQSSIHSTTVKTHLDEGKRFEPHWTAFQPPPATASSTVDPAASSAAAPSSYAQASPTPSPTGSPSAPSFSASAASNATRLDRSTHRSRAADSLDRSRGRTTEASHRLAAVEATRQRLEQAHQFAEEKRKSEARMKEILEENERTHTAAQADLLSAFQSDRLEAEQRHRRELDATRDRLEQSASDLAAHRALYADYSERIQAELHDLRQEVVDAEATIGEQSNGLIEYQTHSRSLEQEILHLRDEIEREKLTRADWERDLVKQSQDVIQLKELSFNQERTEWEKSLSSFSSQLEQQIAKKLDAEKRYEEAHAKYAQAQEKLNQVDHGRGKHEVALRETESILKEQRELNAEMTNAYSHLEKLLHATRIEAQTNLQRAETAEREFRDLEAIYRETAGGASDKMTRMQVEQSRLLDLVGGERQRMGALEKELRESKADREALQHTFLRIRERMRLQKLFCHWICITQAKQSRNREMASLLIRRVRDAKQSALARWYLQANLIQLRTQHAASQQQTLTLKADAWRKARAEQKKRRAFREWQSEVALIKQDHQRKLQADSDRLRRDREASLAAQNQVVAATAAEIERGKKVELFRLLQSERAAWADQKEAWEKEVQEREARWREEIHAREERQQASEAEIAASHRSLVKLQTEHAHMQKELHKRQEQEADIQRVVQASFTRNHEKQMHSDPNHHRPLPWVQPTRSILKASTSASRAASPPGSPTKPLATFSSPDGAVLLSTIPPSRAVDQHKKDLHSLLYDAKQDELRLLQNEITSEHSRLSALTNMRQEREAAESHGTFLPLTSSLYPAFSQSQSRVTLHDHALHTSVGRDAAVAMAAEKRLRSRSPRSVKKHASRMVEGRVNAKKVKYRPEGL